MLFRQRQRGMIFLLQVEDYLGLLLVIIECIRVMVLLRFSKKLRSISRRNPTRAERILLDTYTYYMYSHDVSNIDNNGERRTAAAEDYEVIIYPDVFSFTACACIQAWGVNNKPQRAQAF